MGYTIVKEEFVSTYNDITYHYTIKDAEYAMDRAETLEEATKLVKEMERYDEIKEFLEEEINFILDQLQSKFDFSSIKAEDKFKEHVKDWL